MKYCIYQIQWRKHFFVTPLEKDSAKPMIRELSEVGREKGSSPNC